MTPESPAARTLPTPTDEEAAAIVAALAILESKSMEKEVAHVESAWLRAARLDAVKPLNLPPDGARSWGQRF